MQNFQALGAPPPDSQNSPFNGEFLATCRPALSTVDNDMGIRSFCFEQFFLHCSVANFIMLTIDVCLMLNCTLFEKFYLHYALCDFDSILLHYAKLFICQSIDREQIPPPPPPPPPD